MQTVILFEQGRLWCSKYFMSGDLIVNLRDIKSLVTRRGIFIPCSTYCLSLIPKINKDVDPVMSDLTQYEAGTYGALVTPSGNLYLVNVHSSTPTEEDYIYIPKDNPKPYYIHRFDTYSDDYISTYIMLGKSAEDIIALLNEHIFVKPDSMASYSIEELQAIMREHPYFKTDK